MFHKVCTRARLSANYTTITSNCPPQPFAKYRLASLGKEWFSSKKHPIGRLRGAVSGEELKEKQEGK
jgi:hypothetical protein